MSDGAAPERRRHILGLGTRRGTRDGPLAAGPALLMLALAVGLILRIAPILPATFPIGDGGLFAIMARDLRTSGPVPPMYSSFNDGSVPFAYPPLGLYVVALLPWDPITTERWLPLVYSLLAIVGAYLLARELVEDRVAGLAALIFAAMPVTWAIDGGGVTRGLGLVLLLVTLWRAAVLLRVPTARNAVVVGLAGGGALLTYPAVGPPGVASVLVLAAARWSWRGGLLVAAAGVVAAVIAAPWLVMVLDRYGLASLTSAITAHEPGLALLRFITVGPSWVNPNDFVVPLALLGLVLAIHHRAWLLPAWALVLLFVPGGEGRYQAVVLATMAASGGLWLGERLREVHALRVGAGIGLAWLLIASFSSGYQQSRVIPPEAVQTMVAISRQTPPGTRFAVVVDDRLLHEPVLDWFPVLSGRISVGTFLGLEWSPSNDWQRVAAIDAAIQRGSIPPNVDAVFELKGGVASWSWVK